jgi:4-amino-4-deoxy-L-arabinose transferase-like glycosyltransferase
LIVIKRFLSSPGKVLSTVALLSLIVSLGFGFAMGLGKPMDGDAYYFYQLAESLSRNTGYVIHDGFWPEDPSMRRLPGWPFMVSVVMRALPFISGEVAMRSLALVLHAVASVFVAAIALRLFRHGLVALVAGAVSTLHPAGLFAAHEGLSESAFVALAAAGTLLLLANLPISAKQASGETRPMRRSSIGMLFGFLLLGLSCLVRANFVLWIAFFAASYGLVILRRRSLGTLGLLVVGGLLFALPPLTWAARNYQICGHFPAFSALRGQTFYGGNNAVVANDKAFWGYWVFPNQIPGETPMVELAQRMTEYEVDCYYYERGQRFVRENARSMPVLLVGKLVRAYVPIPWGRSFPSYASNAFRLVFMIAAIQGFVLFWRRTDARYLWVVGSMVATSVATVLVFYGYSRFAYTVEIFFIPFVSAGVCRVIWRSYGSPALESEL